MLVVDASVMAKWFFDEDGSEQARLLLRRDDMLAAPVHASAELGHVLARRVRDKVLPLASMRDALNGLSRTVVLLPLGPIHGEAAVIATEAGTSFYDALYIAAAIGWNVTVVTADLRLVRTLTRTRWASRLTTLADYAASRISA